MTPFRESLAWFSIYIALTPKPLLCTGKLNKSCAFNFPKMQLRVLSSHFC